MIIVSVDFGMLYRFKSRFRESEIISDHWKLRTYFFSPKYITWKAEIFRHYRIIWVLLAQAGL